MTSNIAPFYYHLPLLIVLISLVYSATRYEEWPSIFNEAFRWGLRMAFFLIGIQENADLRQATTPMRRVNGHAERRVAPRATGKL